MAELKHLPSSSGTDFSKLFLDPGVREDVEQSQEPQPAKISGELAQTYVCEICGLAFPCRTYVNKHFKSVHLEANEEHRQCPKCPMKFKKYDTFWEHVIRAHENPVASSSTETAASRGVTRSKISVADIPVPENEEELEALINSLISKEDSTVCGKCGKRLSTKNGVQRHIKEVHMKIPPNHQRQWERVTCQLCNKSFVNHFVHDAHMRNVHLQPERTQECPQCGKKYKEFKTLKSHMRNVHQVELQPPPKPPRPPRIPEADEIPDLEDNGVEEEDDDNAEETVYPCPTCEISFVSENGLNRHNRAIHKMNVPVVPSVSRARPRPPSNVSDFQQNPITAGINKDDGIEFACADCGKRFPTKTALSAHSITHQKASLEPYVKSMLRTIFGVTLSTNATCTLCETTVANSVEGRLHVYIKHPEKFDELVTQPAAADNGLLKCIYCTDKYPCTESLVAHIEALHPDKYVPTCHVCGHKELKERDIHIHYKRYHPNVPRHICTVCNKGFNAKREFELHMNREHSADAVQCPYCPEKHVKVKLHVTMKHPEKAEEFTRLKNAAIREEQLARKRFNEFLEKGLNAERRKLGKTKRRKKTRKEWEDDDDEEELEMTDSEGDDQGESPPDYDEYGEPVEEKPNVCVVKETKKVAMPELFRLEKPASTPHVIEIRRLPPPQSPEVPESANPELLDESLNESNDQEEEEDIKPDVSLLNETLGEPYETLHSQNGSCSSEKTLVLRLERITEKEILKWAKRCHDAESALETESEKKTDTEHEEEASPRKRRKRRW